MGPRVTSHLRSVGWSSNLEGNASLSAFKHMGIGQNWVAQSLDEYQPSIHFNLWSLLQFWLPVFPNGVMILKVVDGCNEVKPAGFHFRLGFSFRLVWPSWHQILSLRWTRREAYSTADCTFSGNWCRTLWSPAKYWRARAHGALKHRPQEKIMYDFFWSL